MSFGLVAALLIDMERNREGASLFELFVVSREAITHSKNARYIEVLGSWKSEAPDFES